MSNHEDMVRLRHMLDAAQKAVNFVQNRNRVDLDTDEILSLALIRLLEILGEAARGLSKEFRQRNPHIVWQQIIGMRDRLIHGYFDVDMDIVWAILNTDLPPLISDLEKILPSD